MSVETPGPMPDTATETPKDTDLERRRQEQFAADQKELDRLDAADRAELAKDEEELVRLEAEDAAKARKYAEDEANPACAPKADSLAQSARKNAQTGAAYVAGSGLGIGRIVGRWIGRGVEWVRKQAGLTHQDLDPLNLSGDKQVEEMQKKLANRGKKK